MESALTMRSLLPALLILGLAGCEGRIALPKSSPGSPNTPTTPNPTNPDPTMPMPDACANAPISVPASALQRMNGAQLLNTERTLFAQPSFTTPLESGATNVITQLEAQKIDDAASALVLTKGHHTYAPCDVTGSGSDSCAQGFINAFGQKAFRRPVASDEVQWLMQVFHDTLAIAGLPSPITFEEAIDVVAQVIVESPQHLYISALGVADNSLPAGIARMTGYERATRLSYMLTNNTPDDTLLAAAANGDLDDPMGVRAQAQRLLDTTDGHQMVRAFAGEYAGLNEQPTLPALEALPKDAAKFPFDSPALRTAMRAETQALYEQVFFGAGGSFAKLMTSTDAYVNKSLGALYGVTGAPANDSTFAWVTLDGTQRAGFFTRAAFLTENANQDYQSPIRRGVHLYKHTLCQVVPPPPPNVNNVPPEPSATSGMNQSVRQQTETRTGDMYCQSCHSQFNPIGFSLEHYNAMGQWQDVDTGKDANGNSFTVPIDAASTITVSDLKGAVNGGVELSTKLSQSGQAMSCMTRQWFGYAFNRGIAPEDTCTVAAISNAFNSSNDMHALVLDVVASAPNLYVRHD